jgi:hypothetical protein
MNMQLASTNVNYAILGTQFPQLFGASALSNVFKDSFLPVLGAASGEQNLLTAFGDFTSGTLLSNQTLYGLMSSTTLPTGGDTLFAALTKAYTIPQSALDAMYQKIGLGQTVDIEA